MNSNPGSLAPPRLARSLLLVALGAASCSERVTPRSNVLLITLDTTRADHLSCYGHGVRTTPTLDALAEDGILFERALSSSGLTPMAHASILTGLPSHQHGLRVFHGTEAGYRLDGAAITLAEVLRENGWRTAARVSAYPASEIFGLDQGFESFEAGIDFANLDLSDKPKAGSFLLAERQNEVQRRADATIDDALSWLAQLDEDEPWFLWVHLFDAHDYTVVPPEEHMQRFGISYDVEIQPRDPSWHQRLYDPEIAYMDTQIARLFDSLRTSGAWDSTLVAVTADHGEGLEDGWNRHQWAKHRLLYDWCLHVPLILRLPSDDRPQTRGARIDAPVRTLDITPTVLDSLGLEGPRMFGESLLATLSPAASSAPPRVVFAEALNLYDSHTPASGLPEHCEDNLFCVIEGRWKLIWHAEEPANHELFDLEADPRELDNRAQAEPEVVARLHALLEDAGAFQVRPQPAVDGRPDAAALEALGYGGDGK